MYTVLASRKRLSIALLTFSLSLIILTFIYSPYFHQYTNYAPDLWPTESQTHTCPPEAYAAGNWARRFNPPGMAGKDNVLLVSGFDGCASSREVDWHLGLTWNDEDEHQKLHWRANASAYTWIPGDACEGYTRVQPQALIRQLVEEGGWLVLGDSITECHFFSLSCMLFPHVRATPDYTIDPWSFDRAWPQNLYLSPSSPLLAQLNFPDGFEIDSTPLITFRRVDLLLGKPELNALYSKLHPSNGLSSLFSDEATWDLDSSAYLPQFFAPLPQGNYRTLVISTAGHWTTSLFSAFHNDDTASGYGLVQLLDFFSEAMSMWLDEIVAGLEETDQSGRSKVLHRGRERQVVVRSYIHGHESCHDAKVELAGPLGKYQQLKGTWYNWNWIRRYNDVFHRLIKQRAHPNIHFLPIDMPALLRPDGHVQGDCLHILTGSGIMEGWSEYISYFVSQLP